MLYGCAWYPEQWPESDWDQDLSLMREAGFNVVRIGEFAWSTMEPAEGRYDLDFLARAADRAAAHGIKTILCTPTAAPPAWLTARYPQTLRVLANGHTLGHGMRVHFNPLNPTYLRFCENIAAAMARRLGGHAAVLGWQLDNEIGELSYDPATRTAFQQFLRECFGTLDALNAAWTTAYWSQTYTAWEQIPLYTPGQNKAMIASWRAFCDRTWKHYLDIQADQIRPHLGQGQFITHNFSYEYAMQDPHAVSDSLDLCSVDPYCFTGDLDPANMGFYLAATRDVKRRFFVMETQPGFINYARPNTALDPGVTRRMIYHQLGHGAEAILFWQWCSALAGQEQYHGTLVGPDRRPRPVFAEIARAGREFASIADALKDTRVEPAIALAWHAIDRHAVNAGGYPAGVDAWAKWGVYYGALRTLGLDVAATTVSRATTEYKLVFAPQLTVIPPALQQQLLDFVSAGGHLVLGPRGGFYDENLRLLPEARPGALLAAALGASSWEFYALPNPLPVHIVGNATTGTATNWAELLAVSAPDVETLARFGEGQGWLANQPAAITRPVGRGRLTYLAGYFDPATLTAVARWACNASNIPLPWGDLPPGIEVSRRTGKGRTLHILCNHGKAAQTLRLPFTARTLVGPSVSEEVLRLPPNEVAVLQESLA